MAKKKKTLRRKLLKAAFVFGVDIVYSIYRKNSLDRAVEEAQVKYFPGGKFQDPKGKQV